MKMITLSAPTWIHDRVYTPTEGRLTVDDDVAADLDSQGVIASIEDLPEDEADDEGGDDSDGATRRSGPRRRGQRKPA